MNLNGMGPNFHKLQVFSNSLEDLIDETPTFGFILKCIKVSIQAINKVLYKCNLKKIIIEPVCDKNNNLGFRPGPTQTGLYRHRSRQET